MNESEFDVAIIGGGVIGAMTALSLSEKGLRVVVLEKNEKLANEASRAGGGIISPLHPWRYSEAMLDLASWSHQRFSAISHELSCLTGIDVPVRKTGMLVPNTLEAEAALKCSFLRSRVLSPTEVFEVEPGIANRTESVFVEDVHNIRNPALCRALPIAAQKKGIHLKTNFKIHSATKQSDAFVLSSENEHVWANKVVICAGAWSSNVIALFDDTELNVGRQSFSSMAPEIFPVKGQMLAFKAKPGVLRTVVLEQNRYLIPRHDGIVVVGSTVEDAEFDQETTDDAFQELKTFARAMLPALKKYPIVSHWAGLRPGSHRDKPIICAVEQLEGLYLNVGHFRNGLLSAPASAQVLLDVMFNQTSDFHLESYSI